MMESETVDKNRSCGFLPKGVCRHFAQPVGRISLSCKPLKTRRTPVRFGVQEVPSSNLGGPTKFLKDIQRAELPETPVWSPLGVQNGRRLREVRTHAKSCVKFLAPLSSYKKPDKPDIWHLIN